MQTSLEGIQLMCIPPWPQRNHFNSVEAIAEEKTLAMAIIMGDPTCAHAQTGNHMKPNYAIFSMRLTLDSTELKAVV